jgi:hypothetical protein
MTYRLKVNSRSPRGGILTTVACDFRGQSTEGNRLIGKRTANPNDFRREMNEWAKQITGRPEKAKDKRTGERT